MRHDLGAATWCRALAALAAVLLGTSTARAQPAGGIDPSTSTTTATPTPTAAATATPTATPAPRRVRFVASAGYDYGFEEFFTADLEGGGSDRLPANGGSVLSVGAAYLPLPSGALELRATAGVKFATISASNGSAYYLAFPVELLAGWNIQRVRLSAGASLSLAPRVRGSEFFEGVDFDLKSSLGLVGQADWVFPFSGASGSFSIGARFLLQKLEPKSGGRSHDANALGLVAGVSL